MCRYSVLSRIRHALRTYPYPLEMRFGVRYGAQECIRAAGACILRSVRTCGLTLKVGDYVPGLDPSGGACAFLDAGHGDRFAAPARPRLIPTNIFDGYTGRRLRCLVHGAVPRRQDSADRCEPAALSLEPGTVMRYRDQGLLHSRRCDRQVPEVGARTARADLGGWFKRNLHADRHPSSAGRQEPQPRGPRPGAAMDWSGCNAGYYPTLRRSRQVAMLYEARGTHGGAQDPQSRVDHGAIGGAGCHRQREAPMRRQVRCPRRLPDRAKTGSYKMRLSLPALRQMPAGTAEYLPSMHGSGDK